NFRKTIWERAARCPSRRRPSRSPGLSRDARRCDLHRSPRRSFRTILFLFRQATTGYLATEGNIVGTVKSSSFKRIAFIGNHLPRQCGIATFTTDVCEAVATAYPETACYAVPVNDTSDGYDYPPRVRFEVEQNELA